jgi:hypothetical protein
MNFALPAAITESMPYDCCATISALQRLNPRNGAVSPSTAKMLSSNPSNVSGLQPICPVQNALRLFCLCGFPVTSNPLALWISRWLMRLLPSPPLLSTVSLNLSGSSIKALVELQQSPDHFSKNISPLTPINGMNLAPGSLRPTPSPIAAILWLGHVRL